MTEQFVSNSDGELRALSLYQPWAWLVSAGHKSVENRPWTPPRWLHNRWFLIHAGKVWDDDGADMAREFGIASPAAAPGAFIGAARFVGLVMVPDCGGELINIPTKGMREGSPLARWAEALGQQDVDKLRTDPRVGRWCFGPFGWVLADQVLFAKPVAARGFQGLWTVGPAQHEAAEEQWRGGRP